MSESMDVLQLQLLLKKIYEEHNPIYGPKKPNFRSIKYVDPVFDNRDGRVFSVTLRSFGQENGLFHVCNEQRDLEDSLYDRIIYWLEHK